MGIHEQIFSRPTSSVGNLPGLPVFLDLLCLPEQAKLRTMWVPATSFRGERPEWAKGKKRSFWTVPEWEVDNYYQVLPPPTKDFAEMSLEEHNAHSKEISKVRTYLVGDCYAVRKAFDAVDSTEEMVAFLKECGPFIATTGEQYVTWDGFQKLQRYFDDWRTSTRRPRRLFPCIGDDLEILSGSPSWDIRSSDPTGREVLCAFLECRTAIGAIAATIINDCMQGVRWRRCGYEHCLEPRGLFRPTKQVQRFCDRTCKQKARRQQRNRELKENRNGKA